VIKAEATRILEDERGKAVEKRKNNE